MKPWGAADATSPSLDRRVQFVDWLVRPDNPYFARVEVNRIWADLFGRGIVDPVDDFRSSNPPSNAPLLDALASEFVKSGYDRKTTVRLICNSRAYQSSTETSKFNATDQLLFSHARPRLLMAEQLKDAMALTTRTLPSTSDADARLRQARIALSQAAAGPERERLQAEIARLETRNEYATQRLTPDRQAFNIAFGQPERSTACTCERQSAPTLLQALEVLNGNATYKMAQNAASNYAGIPDAKLIEEIYLAGLCRYPTPREASAAGRYLSVAKTRQDGITDLMWALLSTQEFMFQH